MGDIFPSRDLPSHSQILVRLGLINSAGLILTTENPSYHKGVWAPSGSQLDLLYPGRFAEWPQTQHWHWVLTCISWVNTTYPNLVTHRKIYLMQFKYCQRVFQRLSLTGSQQVKEGRGRIWGALGRLLTCSQHSTVKSWPYCAAWSFPHTLRPSTGSHKLWIAL